MRRAILSFLVVILLLAGCKAEATVNIALEADGSGVVTVAVVADAAVVAQLDDPATTAVVDDLMGRGWSVEGPIDDVGGKRWSATKPFADVQGLSNVLSEVGIFSATSVSVDADRSGRTVKFSTNVDLSRGLDTFGDEELGQVTDGALFGVDPAVFASRTGVDIASALAVSVTIDPPGEVTSSNATEPQSDQLVWKPQYLAVTPVQFESRDSKRGLLVTVAAVAAGLAVLSSAVIVWSGHRKSRWRASRGGPRGGIRPMRY